MRRQGGDWINNVALGASCVAERDNEQLEALAVAAVTAVGAVGMDYAGVDVMRGNDGILQVIEVNSIPAWAGLQSTCEFDIAQCLVDDFCARHLPGPAIMAVGQ
jgi:glutathione synthase/RimK-type ligase-like ATP-grasp enzyme